MKGVNIKVNMPLHLKRIDYQCLGIDADEPVPAEDCWYLYSPIATDEDECQLVKDLAELADRRDLKAAVQAVRKLVAIGALGQPLQAHYDEKQCHALHNFHYLGKERVIWRIRKDSIRLPFYYGNGKLIFLTGVLVKRKDKLSPGEQSALEEQIKRYIDAEQADSLCPVT